MSKRKDDFGEETSIVLVTFTNPANLTDYSPTNELLILVDPSRDAYRAYGLGRGSFLRVYGWRAIRRYIEIFREQGLTRLRRSDEDTLQLGGDFVVGPDGSLVYGFWGEGPDQRPSVDELINATKTKMI